MSEAVFLVGESLTYMSFLIVFIVGLVLGYFVISLIGGS